VLRRVAVSTARAGDEKSFSSALGGDAGLSDAVVASTRRHYNRQCEVLETVPELDAEECDGGRGFNSSSGLSVERAALSRSRFESQVSQSGDGRESESPTDASHMGIGLGLPQSKQVR
jgi:hypothetical protein